jgi:hypothetical protein
MTPGLGLAVLRWLKRAWSRQSILAANGKALGYGLTTETFPLPGTAHSSAIDGMPEPEPPGLKDTVMRGSLAAQVDDPLEEFQVDVDPLLCGSWWISP